MAFQSTIGAGIAFGVVGERPYGVPSRGQPAIIRSADAAQNVIGRAMTVVDGATGRPTSANPAADPAPLIVAAGGAGVFAGILANPKVMANHAGLGASLTVPNESAVELLQDDQVIVQLGAASNVGDNVWYLTATGVLVTSAPAAAKPANTGAQAIGRVERFEAAGAGLAVIQLIGAQAAPTS